MSVIKQILKSYSCQQYEEAAKAMPTKVSNVIQQFKNAGDIADFCISLDRNVEKATSSMEFHFDIGFKLCKEDDFSVIVTNIN